MRSGCALVLDCSGFVLALYLLRLCTGSVCAQAELHVLVGEREAPELYAAEPGAPIEVGGLSLKACWERL